LEIGEAYSCRTKTVENIRFGFCESGFKLTLNGKPPAMPPRARKFDVQGEATVIALRFWASKKTYTIWHSLSKSRMSPFICSPFIWPVAIRR